MFTGKGRFFCKWLITAIILVVAIFVFYNVQYTSRVLPNVYLGNVSLAGKSTEELRILVSREIEDFEAKPFIFDVQGSEINVDKSTLGISYDQDKTQDAVFAYGRSGNVIWDLATRIKSPFMARRIEPVYRVDYSKFSQALDNKFASLGKKTSGATIVYEGGVFNVTSPANGESVDRTQLASNIRQRLDGLNNLPIELSKIEELPRVSKEQTQNALEKVKKLNNQKIVLVYGYDSWALAGANLLNILRFYPEGQDNEFLAQITLGTNPIVIDYIDIDSLKRPDLDVSLDGQRLSSFIDEIGSAVDRKTVDATLKFENGKVVEFTPAQDGQELDRKLAQDLVVSKVSTRSGDESLVMSINLPVKVTRAKIASEEINSLGIRELIGRGISYFAGSIANRAYNVSLGSGRLSGTLVKPGEVFSFNNSVGEVSGKTGYRQAYVISEGRTVLDDGGGICQVSTTVFRAALNAGLPIVTRTAHAYRVGYYEQHGFKPGLDATVWAPAVDLQFKNDTDHYVLVQAIVDPSLAKLQVDIYGTSDGRKSIMTDPVISNQTPAPPDKYQDDPTLPKGVTKQVDFAAAGATSVFTRKVYKGDNLIIDDTFRSVYRPWQAIYLVGTGG